MTLDYQRVVEYLRDLRQGALQTVTDEISQAAGDYAALCIQANERLRKCSGFLQQGLRSEAIHLADESPNLLDLVAALDLPDPQTWIEFCQNNGLAVPPPLQMDRAAQLNDAYALDQPLEHLLSRHRLLALSRAPVRERLETLRQIAEIDAATTSWEKDIRVFERARLKELPTAFYNAVKSKNEAAITDLMHELTERSWFEPVPADLASSVADAFNRMQRATCEAELRKLVEPLRDAFAARSLQECQALAQRWKKTMESYNVTRIGADLEDEIKPVVAFINESEKREEFMKRFRESCRAFGRMLDRDQPDAELEAAFAKLSEFKEPIPDELLQRYAEKQKSRQRAIDRAHKVRLLTIGASIAGILVVVLLTGFLLMRGNAARAWGQKIQQANARRNLDDAHKIIDQLQKSQPGLLTDPAVAPYVAETRALQTRYDNDTVILDSLVQEMDAADKQASPVAANKQATVEETLSAVAAVQEALDKAQQAGDLKWVDTQNKFADGTIRLQALATGLRTRASDAVREDVRQQTAKLDAMVVAPGATAQDYVALTQIAGRLTALKAAGGIDDDARAAVAALSHKVDERRTALEAMHDVAGELENIRQQATSADALKKALDSFMQRFPSDPRTPEFTQAALRMPLGKAVEAWRNLTAQWSKQMAPPSTAVAQKRLDAITGYMTVYPDSPMASTAAAYADYAKRAADALAEKGTWQAGFESLLADPRISELAYLETTDKRRFYVIGNNDQIERKERRINDLVSVTFLAVDPANSTKRINVEVDSPTKVSEKPLLTPHARLAQELADSIKRVSDNDWETFGIDFIEKVRGDESVDLVVRAILIQQTLKIEDAVAGWALNDAYARAMTDLARQKPEELNFIDPNQVSAGAKKALKEIIDAIPHAAAVKQTLAAKKSDLFKAASFDITATGVALKDDGGHWTIAANGGPMNGQLMWTVIPGSGSAAAAPAAAPAPAPASASAEGAAPASAPATAPASSPPAPPANPGALLQIGIMTKGKYALYENAQKNLPQGSIIYFTRP